MGTQPPLATQALSAWISYPYYSIIIMTIENYSPERLQQEQQVGVEEH